MIAIVDYGMGNLRSVSKAFQNQGFEVSVTKDPDVIDSAGGLVLPGQGAFGDCVRNLEENGIFGTIREYIQSGRPYLGICLGLQVLFEESEESPGVSGLGVDPGEVNAHPPSVERKVESSVRELDTSTAFRAEDRSGVEFTDGVACWCRVHGKHRQG